MADGAPNGYSTLIFDGNQYKLDFKAAGLPKDYQLSVHAPEEVTSAGARETYLYANFFNGSVESRLQFKVGEHGPWRQMEKSAEEDPYFRRIYQAEQSILTTFEAAGLEPPFRKLNSARPSEHLWKANLPPNLPSGTHLIYVRATDRHGRVFDGKRVLRVK